MYTHAHTCTLGTDQYSHTGTTFLIIFDTFLNFNF